MRQKSSPETLPESFILSSLILHLKSITITKSVVLETGVMRKVLGFQILYRAYKK